MHQSVRTSEVGLIERSDREVEEQARTLKSRTSECYLVDIRMDHKLMPWLLRHASWLVCMLLVKNPCERIGGRHYKGEIVEFVEHVNNNLPIGDLRMGSLYLVGQIVEE